MNSNNYLKFDEPGLLIKLSGESDFPKNIKEDEPFPEFMNYNKRQSKSIEMFDDKVHYFYET